MTQANELRVGNLVTYNPLSVDEGTPIIPLSISCVDNQIGVILDDGFTNCYTWDEILPIELTEEILFKFGFVSTSIQGDILTLFLSDSDKDEFSRQRIDFWKNNQDGKVELCRGGVCFKMVICKYVHQLQNLFFCLTYKELECSI